MFRIATLNLDFKNKTKHTKKPIVINKINESVTRFNEEYNSYLVEKEANGYKQNNKNKKQ